MKNGQTPENQTRNNAADGGSLQARGSGKENFPETRKYGPETARKRLEEASARENLLLHSLPMAFYVAQPFGDYGGTWVSEQIGDICGFASEEFMEDTGLWASRLHPDDREKAMAAFDSIREVGSIEVEYRWKSKGGDWLWFRDNATLAYGQTGESVQVVGTWLDITERKKMESRLRLMDMAMEKSNVPMTLTDIGNRFIHVNEATCRLMGYTRDELLEMSIPDIDLNLDVSSVEALYNRLKQENFFIHRTMLEHRDGTHIPVEVAAQYFHFEGEEFAWTYIRDLREEKRREAVLRESQDRYQSLFKGATDGIILVKDTLFIDCNPAIERLFDLPREKILGLHPADLSPPVQPDGEETHSKAQRLFKAAMEGKPQIFEWRHITGKGVPFDVEVTMDGTVIGEETFIQAFLRDISERKQAEEELRKREEDYRSIFHGTNDAILVHDAETGEILDVNQAGLEMYGYRREELVNLDVADLSAPGSIFTNEYALSLLRKAAMGDPQLFEWHGRNKKGDLFWEEVTLKKAMMGGKARVLAVVRDITSRKKTRWEIDELRALLAASVEQSPAGIIIANAPDVTIRMANSAGLNIRGSSPRPLTEIPVDDHAENWQTFYPDGSPMDPKDLPLSRAVLQGETSQNVEVVIRREDGEERTVLANASPVRDEEGNIQAGIVVFLDITELRKAREEAEQQREQLIQADKLASLGTLVSGIAHEINNPNMFVMLNAPVLKEIWNDVLPVLKESCRESGTTRIGSSSLEELEKTVPTLLTHIHEGAERIKKIVEGLKGFARQETVPVPEDVDVNDVIRRAVLLIDSRIRDATDRFFSEYATDLPVIRSNGQRIEQVMVNLIINACDALSDRRQAVVVSTAIDRERQRMVLRVKDEGSGMSEEMLGKIRYPFFTTKRDSNGTGLGLSISTRILEELGGSLVFESLPGKGTTATVELPVEASEGSIMEERKR